MKYSGKNDKYKAEKYLSHLIETNSDFEIKRITKSKTLSQLRYLHLILSWFAIETGYSLQFVKLEYFKKEVNKDIFYLDLFNNKTGAIYYDYRSCADLDKMEMTTAIQRFRNYSSLEANIYLPEPSEYHLLQDIENNIEKYAEYLF